MSRDRRAADHASYDELAVGWALHALEPEDEATFAAHLPGCERCARTVAETSDVMAAMAADLPVAEPSEELRQRLAEAVENTEQVGRRDPVPPEPENPDPSPAPAPAPASALGRRTALRPVPAGSRWRRTLPTALVAAAVAAIVGLGIWNVTLAQNQDHLQSTVAEQSQIMNELLSPGRAAVAPLAKGGKTVATVVARDGGVDVVASGLAVNDPAANTYVLWGMRGNTPVPLGTFDVVQAQLDLRTVGSGQAGLARYTTFGVSLEPGRRAPAAPTHMVALGQVSS